MCDYKKNKSETSFGDVLSLPSSTPNVLCANIEFHEKFIRCSFIRIRLTCVHCFRLNRAYKVPSFSLKVTSVRDKHKRRGENLSRKKETSKKAISMMWVEQEERQQFIQPFLFLSRELPSKFPSSLSEKLKTLTVRKSNKTIVLAHCLFGGIRNV